MNEFDKFAEWCDQTAFEIKQWPILLEQEAFKQMRENDLTIGQTKRLVRSQKPEPPREYNATSSEVFRAGLVSQIIEEAAQKVSQKINDSKLSEDNK